ncbi:MAG: ATP-binding cassette domain-containing protein [Eubacteriales bacterium]|nr:ATP-binding cassette domain-containing protein [Eubacteriales bacterium]
MILACHHITKEYPGQTVLRDVTFHLEKGDKAAIVGINGAGKTTLLRIITGSETADQGTVSFGKDCSFGYLAQDQGLSSDRTIYEEVLSVMQDLIDMENRLTAYEQMLETTKGNALTETITQYTDLLHEFERRGGYAYKGEVTGVLRGLGFADEEFDQSIATLSGGQKTRVALGKILLRKPDIIMLDEPTNHLDMSSIRWLETYLSNYRGTVLVVSHDRYFLDKTVNRIIELENSRAMIFSGNYSAYAERKKALREQQYHAYLSNQAQIRHQEEVIEKLRRFNREKSIKRAESREKMLQRMEVLEKPVEIRDDMQLHFTPCIKSGREVLTVEGLAKSYGDKHLFSDISFRIHRGEHVALIGDNGTGKTTILSILNEVVPADRGVIRYGTNVHVGYYDQEYHVLHDDKTVFEEISDEYPAMTNTQIRSLLATFLFTGEDVFKMVGDLSGGEKGRVSLAKLMLSKCNFLILDEPTNHLDMVSKEVLENALNYYEGTVLYVSHDRYFINHTASRILSLTGSHLLNYPGGNEEKAPDCYIGNYDYYLEKSAQIEETLLQQAKEEASRAALSRGTSASGGLGSAKAPGSPGSAETPGSAKGAQGRAPLAQSSNTASAQSDKDDWKRQKEEKARLRKAANDLKKCEDRIAQLEEESASIDEQMGLPDVCADAAKLSELSLKKAAIEEELEQLYIEWEEKSEQL